MGWPRWDYKPHLSQIQEWCRLGMSYKWIARQLDVSKPKIGAICRKEGIQHLPVGNPKRRTYDFEQIRMWAEEGRTQQWVADRTGGNIGAIGAACRRRNIHFSYKGSAPGHENPNWKGGKCLDGKGYVLLYMPDYPGKKTRKYYVREHRYVMEQKIGRLLKPKEEVHHIDGNKQNNHPDNLQLYRNSAEHHKCAHPHMCHLTVEARAKAHLNRQLNAAKRRDLTLDEYTKLRDAEQIRIFDARRREGLPLQYCLSEDGLESRRDVAQRQAATRRGLTLDEYQRRRDALHSTTEPQESTEAAS